MDDERQNRQLLEVMLARGRLCPSTAASGEEALAIIAEHPPDLILLDIMMPGMSGYEVASKIKGNAATRNIPVIMVTALDDRDARMLGLNAGAEDFLSKPVDRAELCVRVRNLLASKPMATITATTASCSKAKWGCGRPISSRANACIEPRSIPLPSGSSMLT